MVPAVLVVGTYVQDLTFRCERIPGLGESVVGNFATGPGGKGFNQAVASTRAGIPTGFIGAVGRDAFAAGARQFCREAGLKAHFVEKPGHATAAAAVLLNRAGQNQIVVGLGAGARLRPRDIDLALVRGARVLLCQQEVPPAVNAHILRAARRAGAVTILNPAPMRTDFAAEMLRNVDTITPNETEFAAMANLLFPGKKQLTAARLGAMSPAALHAVCRRLGVAAVIITLGERGVLVSQASGFALIPAHRVKVVDTTGAGDAFAGGLAAGLVEFKGDLLSAARLGNAIAALKVTKPGAAPAMPSRGEIVRFLRRERVALPFV